MRSTLSQLRVVACLVVFAALSALSQDRGTIRGSVIDESGAAVPDAPVTVANSATG